MKPSKIGILLCSIFLTGVVFAGKPPKIPRDVLQYIQDRMGCNQIGREDYSDPSRASAMAQELRECGMGGLKGVPVSTYTVVTVDMKEKSLRKKYRKQPQILRAIDEAKDRLP